MFGLYGCFPKIGVVPQNGRFIMENPIKMDDMGGTPIFGNTHMGYRYRVPFIWFILIYRYMVYMVYRGHMGTLGGVPENF